MASVVEPALAPPEQPATPADIIGFATTTIHPRPSPIASPIPSRNSQASISPALLKNFKRQSTTDLSILHVSRKGQYHICYNCRDSWTDNIAFSESSSSHKNSDSPPNGQAASFRGNFCSLIVPKMLILLLTLIFSRIRSLKPTKSI